MRRLAEKLPAVPFGDVYEDSSALARATGFPLWLADAAIERYGKANAGRYLFASNDPAPVFFTVNACKTADESILSDLDAANIAYVSGGIRDEVFGPLPVSYCWKLERAADVAHEAFAALIREGKVIVSDAAAQAIAIMALPDEPPASMLEVGAGRGTKTLLLQSAAVRRYGHTIPLTSIDYMDFKAELLKSRLETAGIVTTEVLVADGTDLDAAFGKRTFDAVFIDAPCSGLGTLRRHPEIRWRITPEDIASLAGVGVKMLASAAPHLASGGLMTYSSCTFTPEETTELTDSFLASPAAADIELIPYGSEGESYFASILSHGTGDAHFAARFRRAR